MPTTSSSPKQIPALTGLRALAALAVLVYHLREIRNGYFYDFGWLNTLLEHGDLGVDIFFVLSGFIIYYVYKKTFANGLRANEWARFLQRRFARLYPLHLITLCLMLAAYAIGRRAFGVVPNNEAYYTWQSVLNNLVMTHAWFPNVGAPNTPAWSISAEWFAYLLFPFLCIAFGRSPRVVAVVAIPIALFAAHYLGPIHPLFRVSSEFLYGMALSELHAKYRLGERFGKYASLTVAGLAVCFLYLLQRPVLFLHVGLFGLLIVTLANPQDIGARLLSSGVAVYLGEISYSIYMGQWFIWVSFKHAVPRLAPWFAIHDLILMGLAAVAVVAFAALLHRVIEVPGRRFISGLSGARLKLLFGSGTVSEIARTDLAE